MEEAQRRAWSVRALGIVVSLPAVATAVRAAFVDWRPMGTDMPLIYLHSREVGGPHTPLVGAWSRYGWDHPGPLMFYVAAPAVRLLGPEGLMLTMGLVSALAAAGAVLAAARVGGLRLATVTAGVVAVTMYGINSLGLVEPWNPYVVVLPLLAYLICAWGAAQGDRVLLLAAVVAGTWCSQAHVATVPVVGLTALLGVIWSVATKPEAEAPARIPRRWLIGAAALFLLLWLPPLWEQAFHEGGNLSALYRFNGRGEQVGVDEALKVSGHTFGLPAPWMGAPETSPFGYLGARHADPLRAELMLVVAAVVAGLGWWRYGRRVGGLAALAVLLVVVSVVAMARSTDEVLLIWTVRWAWGVAAFAWIGPLFVLAVAARDRLRAVPPAAVVAAMCVAVLALGLRTTTDGAATRVLTNPESTAVRSLGHDLRDALDPDTTYVFSIEAPGALFGFVAPLTVDLLTHDRDIVLREAFWEVSFGERFVADPGREYPRIVVVPRVDPRWSEQLRVRGAEHLASYDPLSSAERRESDRLLREVVSEIGWTDRRPVDLIDAARARDLLAAGGDPGKVERLRSLYGHGPALDAWLLPPGE